MKLLFFKQSSTNPFISSLSKKSSTTNSSGTYTTTATSNTTGSYLPFNYQQALAQRCTYILNKMQTFLQFHLIENYGCDFASNGLTREVLENKLRCFFQKKTSIENSYYNTYLLYYCGPTSSLTDNLTFMDGNELALEQIIDIWKQVHLNEKIDLTTPNELEVVVSASGSEEEDQSGDNKIKQEPDDEEMSAKNRNTWVTKFIINDEYYFTIQKHVFNK